MLLKSTKILNFQVVSRWKFRPKISLVNLIHNNVCLSSIFIDRAGEWKLFGLEYMFGGEDYPPTKVSHGLDKYEPPEKSSRKKSCKWSSDMWGLGKSWIRILQSLNFKIFSLSDLGGIQRNNAKFECNETSWKNSEKFDSSLGRACIG